MLDCNCWYEIGRILAYTYIVMTFYGISQNALYAIAQRLDLRVENMRKAGRGVALKLSPANSDHKYARTSARGRRLVACSYEAFRDFTLSAFANGATDVATQHPRLRATKRMTRADFEDLLDDFRNMNIGSQMEPCTMGETSNDHFPPVVVEL